MKLLAISHAAPPRLTPQAIQVARLLYHLDADVTLLHAGAADADAAFSGLDQYPHFFGRVKPLAVADPGPALRDGWQCAAMRLLPGYGACPDLFGRWRRRARRSALECIAGGGADVLASFGIPMTCHLLALELKRASGVPWLAHFSDLWADHPSHQTGRLEQRLNAALERSVIGSADCVLFTSTRMLDLVMAKYPAAWRPRSAVLPPAWDTDNFTQAGASSPGRSQQISQRSDCSNHIIGHVSGPVIRHVVRHLGACDGACSPEPLFAALGCIAAGTPRLLDGVRFEFVGPVAPALLATGAFTSLPPGLVSIRPAVGYRHSLQLARDSAALLLIEAPSATGSVCLPGKLIDYIGAGRPVWGIAPPGAAADLIGQWASGPHACADPADPDAVARMLAGRIAALHAEPRRAGSAALAHRFAPQRVAHGLRLALEQVIAGAARAPFLPRERALPR